jgi:hypothetical protein
MKNAFAAAADLFLIPAAIGTLAQLATNFANVPDYGLMAGLAGVFALNAFQASPFFAGRGKSFAAASVAGAAVGCFAAGYGFEYGQTFSLLPQFAGPALGAIVGGAGYKCTLAMGALASHRFSPSA